MAPFAPTTNNMFCLLSLESFQFSFKSQTIQSATFWLRKMFILNYILIISCLFELIFAELKPCSELQDKKSKKEAFICLTNEAGYSAPFPINSKQDLYFKNIIKIDEDLNSISIQAQLWTHWSDPGLTLKNGQV